MMSDLDAREVLEDRSGTEQQTPTDAGESDETADGPRRYPERPSSWPCRGEIMTLRGLATAPRKYFPDAPRRLHSRNLSTVPNIPRGRHRRHTRQVESMRSNPTRQSDACSFELRVYTVVSVLKTCAYLDCLLSRSNVPTPAGEPVRDNRCLANSKSNDPLVKIGTNAHRIHRHLEQRTCMNSVNAICEDGLEERRTRPEEGKRYQSENISKSNCIQSYSVAHLPLGKHISPLPIPSPCTTRPFYTRYGGPMRNLHLLVFSPRLGISNQFTASKRCTTHQPQGRKDEGHIHHER